MGAPQQAQVLPEAKSSHARTAACEPCVLLTLTLSPCSYPWIQVSHLKFLHSPPLRRCHLNPTLRGALLAAGRQ